MIDVYLATLPVTAMQRGRSRATLLHAGRIHTVTSYVELGALLSGPRGSRWLVRSDGMILTERDLTTTALDFAAWLIAKRDAAAHAPVDEAAALAHDEATWEYAGRCVRERRK